MASGPSKEELEYFFKNSRQYFDELAKEYYNSDREYYDKYIAPFYNPITGKSQHNRLPLQIILVSAIVSVLFGLGIVTFFILTMENNTKNPEPESKQVPSNKTEVQPDSSYETTANTIIDTTIESLKNVSDYQKGLVYYNMKNYEKAEEYFKKVPSSDANYKDARHKINEIRSLNPNNKNSAKPRAPARAR
jgi:tetratricopeptide (TPR) repeat protein